jgi:sodium-dependent phosphate cotransporter
MRKTESKLLKIIFLLITLYVFLLSIDLFGAAFRLFGKDLAEKLITSTSNPFVGLLIGLLATSVIQSSSTTTSILVALVGAGAISVENAVPIVMGANIGTTITNVFVSLAHIGRKAEFEKAFAGAVVHDFFNLLAVLIFFPLQLSTRFLSIGATFMANQFQNVGGLHFASPIKVIVQPAEHLVVQLCGQMPIVIILVALLLLFLALRYLVIILKSLFLTRMEAFFDRYIFKTTLRSLLFGLILTVLVQSSSVTTSLVVPLLAADVLKLRQIYPYTLGANVGTTITAILAALATEQVAAVTVAFAHLLFNISGVIVFLPLREIPIRLARASAKLALKNRLYPIIFVIVTFFLIPLGLLFLSN